jgi:hypothetical protein
MSLAEENKIIMARGGALAALIALAMSGDREREVKYNHPCIKSINQL